MRTRILRDRPLTPQHLTFRPSGTDNFDIRATFLDSHPRDVGADDRRIRQHNCRAPRLPYRKISGEFMLDQSEAITISWPTPPRRGHTTQAYRILVAQHDGADADALIRGLRRLGHIVDCAKNGNEIMATFSGATILLLDLDLPDRDGLEICRSIRMTSNIPIIVVTARESEVDRVLALQTGVDDYVSKPYGFRELAARIEAVMRRALPQQHEEGAISYGPLHIDASRRQVRLNGRRIDMTRKEFDVLHLLAAHSDSVVPRKLIMHLVWGDTWSRRTLDTHVSSIRGKLGSATWIETVRGVGFKIGYRSDSNSIAADSQSA